MATIFSNTLVPDNSTAPHFQAWAQFFEDTLVTTGGWFVTSDTGQTLPSALTIPIAGNSKRGYRVYQMSDSGVPVFMRIDFGSSSNQNVPGIWYTIGTGSNGTGTITGVLYNGGASAAPNVSCNTNQTFGPFNSYGSAMAARASIAMFVSSNPAFHFVFTISRTKDSSGADTNDGLLIILRDGQLTSNGIQTSRYIIYAGGVQPTAETGLNYILTTRSPSESFGGDIGVGIVSHFKGLAQQPGTAMLITNSNDVSAESTITATFYGAARTYIQLNAFPPYKGLVGSSVIDSNARCLMRYD